VGRFTVITGVSGSGKSTLMRGIFKPAIAAALSGTAKSRKKTLPGQPWRLVRGTEAIETVYEVDQTPIGKTSRSTPATYIKVFDAIRDVFAQVPLARMRGYTPARFSFNADGGRCETCAGQGVVRVEMQFLPVSYTPCQDCHGRRFNAGTLEVLYSGASIGDVMEMSLEQARDHFAAVPKIHRPLKILCETGLGYLRLGQPSPTLSGGEAQRIKLVSELVRGSARSETAILRRNRKTKSILYLLEEPTIGLHIADVAELLKVLHRLVDDGATVVLIEHHLAIVADADYVIDMGPEAGPAGGTVVATGTPEEIACNPESRTAPYLRELLPAETPLPLARKKRTAGKMRPD
jgi:excinuclease ABC subunit A